MNTGEHAGHAEPATLAVPASTGEYQVVIGAGVLDEAHVYVREAAGDATAVLIVADETVAALGYASRVETALSRAFAQVTTAVVPAGESSKSFAHAVQ